LYSVLDVQKTLFSLLHPIRLIVEHGRYEPWVWGTARRDRQLDIEIWPNGDAGGEAIWDVIRAFRSSRDGVADEGWWMYRPPSMNRRTSSAVDWSLQND
jgi:hypothetical protein